MTNGKYIMFDNGGTKIPLLFPATLNHKDVADTVPNWTVLSAGSVSFVGHEAYKVHAQCFGESVTLGVRPQKGDAEIINQFFVDNF